MRASRNYKIGVGTVNPTPSQNLIIKLKVSEATVPLLSSADYKYNKEVVFMTGFDDSLANQLGHAYKVFQGGVSSLNGIDYEGLKYSDGTGKMINFRGMLVMITGIVEETNENNINIYTWPEVREALANGWTICNHTAYHGGGDYPWDSLRNMKLAEQQVWDKTGYKMIINTAPAADNGYMYTGRELGYLAHSSTYQEGNDSVMLYDRGTPKQVIDHLADYPTGWFNLGREYFGDNFEFEQVNNTKAYIDRIFNQAVDGVKYMGNWLTHGPGDPENFVELYNYILYHPSNTNQNRIWMPSPAEFLEYFHVKKDSKISHKLSGDILTITIDQSSVNRNIRDRGMSLIASGLTIVSVESTKGWDDVTFNSSTGLINLYKTAVNKATDPSLQILPAQITSLVASGNAVLITYDKAVTQSMTAAYTVSGKTVTGISGSGKNWTLICNSAVNPGDTMSYRMYNGTSSYKGDAITVSTGKRVCDYINFPIS